MTRGNADSEPQWATTIALGGEVNKVTRHVTASSPTEQHGNYFIEDKGLWQA